MPAEDADRPLVLLGYSKGAPDILEALVEYPELTERVEAVVSLAGAVRGSPLSENATQAQANMLTLVPGSACEKEDGDNDAVRSLLPDVRREWLEQNPLPETVSYYSIVAFPEPERVSWALRNSWLLLGETDVRNDSQLVIFDQIIPGSTVMAVVNADHWAVAVPIQRSHRFVGATFVSRNDYPREAFLEAMLRFLEEDLAGRPRMLVARGAERVVRGFRLGLVRIVAVQAAERVGGRLDLVIDAHPAHGLAPGSLQFLLLRDTGQTQEVLGLLGLHELLEKRIGHLVDVVTE